MSALDRTSTKQKPFNVDCCYCLLKWFFFFFFFVAIFTGECFHVWKTCCFVLEIPVSLRVRFHSAQWSPWVERCSSSLSPAIVSGAGDSLNVKGRSGNEISTDVTSIPLRQKISVLFRHTFPNVCVKLNSFHHDCFPVNTNARAVLFALFFLRVCVCYWMRC